MKGKCDYCHGTSFVEGFFAPIEIQIAFDSNPVVVKIPVVGEQQTKNIKARTSNYPLINPRDMITNKDDFRRWTITQVDITKLPNAATGRNQYSRSNYIISQLLNLAELDPADPKHGVILVGGDRRALGQIESSQSSSAGDGEARLFGGLMSGDESTISGEGSVS